MRSKGTERWRFAGPLAPSYHQSTDVVNPGIRAVQEVSKRWVTVVVNELTKYEKLPMQFAALLMVLS
eukprot:6184763-Ditylum_brightwellii.AAC.1